MPAYNRCQDLPYEGMNALAYFSKISHWHCGFRQPHHFPNPLNSY